LIGGGAAGKMQKYVDRMLSKRAEKRFWSIFLKIHKLTFFFCILCSFYLLLAASFMSAAFLVFLLCSLFSPCYLLCSLYYSLDLAHLPASFLLASLSLLTSTIHFSPPKLAFYGATLWSLPGLSVFLKSCSPLFR
jgi:hypothetical protein